MQNDSAALTLDGNPSSPSTRHPKKSTLTIIRQFSRSYIALTGVSLGSIICN